jgi:CIC family chloride channel protein
MNDSDIEKAQKTEKLKYHSIGPISTYFVAIGIGICTGIGAAAFRGLIGFLHNLLFIGAFSFRYDASIHTPESPWGYAIILVPVLGSIGVTFLITHFAPEAKGHGVPEVIDAVYYKRGTIRPSVTWIKALASALSIGSGGSVGREGPIIQIGSAFGSWLGQIFNVPPWEKITWLACGAGGGIAATFNTPIGGILFATEIILQEVSVRTLVPVALATATASFIGRMFFGNSPAFLIPTRAIPHIPFDDLLQLFAYAGLGLLLGLVSELFIQSIYRSEDFFEAAIPKRPYLRHTIGMLLVGVIMFMMYRIFGHYYVEGVGYAAIQDIFSGTLPATHDLLPFLLLLFVAKLIVTSLTLGSGASGGVFSPALFMGATFGEAYGLALQQVFPRLEAAPASFAVVGMAGVVGGTTGAAVTAIVMVYEMTMDYSVIVPMTITVAISYAVRTLISKQSIYTLKLQRRGHAIPNALQANLAFIRKTSELADAHFAVFPSSMSLSDFFIKAPSIKTANFFLAEKDGKIAGFFTFDDVIKIPNNDHQKSLQEFASQDFITVLETAPLSSVIEKLGDRNARFILVTRETFKSEIADVRGFLPKERIVDTLVEQNELFSSDSNSTR